MPTLRPAFLIMSLKAGTFAAPQLEQNTQANSIPLFSTEPLLPFGNFSIPPFLGFLVRSVLPFKYGGGGRTFELSVTGFLVFFPFFVDILSTSAKCSRYSVFF